jgi:hypothetical protein
VGAVPLLGASVPSNIWQLPGVVNVIGVPRTVGENPYPEHFVSFKQVDLQLSKVVELIAFHGGYLPSAVLHVPLNPLNTFNYSLSVIYLQQEQ